MPKTYNIEEFKIDPNTKGRGVLALLSCIEEKNTSPENIFSTIDKAYATGKHRSPSYIKQQKVKQLNLLTKFLPLHMQRS